MYLGDVKKGVTLRFYWNSFGTSGASITRATNGTVQHHEDGSTTQSTAGITDTEDFDVLTGVHLCAIDTSNAAFSAGKDYAVVLNGAVIDGRTVNAVLAHFSIENRTNKGLPIKNIAFADIPVFLVSSTDHVTPATGKTVTVEKSLDGATTFSATTGTITEAANGVYHFDATAADMNGTNVVFKFTASGTDTRFVTLRTQQ